ncbi:hypothetical protein PV385_19355, partial [Streptomyces stelliscabiei]|uniref:hypothetical protein n=1 Tax=Streptomyces stelliscabiei TaxID=146820 RepID=UPI0029AF71FD
MPSGKRVGAAGGAFRKRVQAAGGASGKRAEAAGGGGAVAGVPPFWLAVRRKSEKRGCSPRRGAPLSTAASPAVLRP